MLATMGEKRLFRRYTGWGRQGKLPAFLTKSTQSRHQPLTGSEQAGVAQLGKNRRRLSLQSASGLPRSRQSISELGQFQFRYGSYVGWSRKTPGRNFRAKF